MRPKKTELGKRFDYILGLFWQFYILLGMSLFVGSTLVISAVLLVMIPMEILRPATAAFFWTKIKTVLFVLSESVLLLKISARLITGFLLLLGATGLSYALGEIRELYFRTKYRLQN